MNKIMIMVLLVRVFARFDKDEDGCGWSSGVCLFRTMRIMSVIQVNWAYCSFQYEYIYKSLCIFGYNS